MLIISQVLLRFMVTILLSTEVVLTKVSKEDATCPPFPHAALNNGKITSFGKDRYSFECDRGYFLSSPSQVRCFRGKWSSLRAPRCSKAEGLCEDPPSVENGRVLGEERHVDSVIKYICNSGYLLLGEDTRHCLRTGHWSGITPACMDESEPIEKVAERLKSKFVTDVGFYSSDSRASAHGRLLDRASLQHGLELVILIDRSSSVDPEDFKTGIGFIKFLLTEFGIKNGENPSGTRAVVITFGTHVDVLFNLDNETIDSPRAASDYLDTLEANGGGTAMEEAFMTVYTQLPPLRSKAKKALFMITDGEPNIGSVENTMSFARMLKKRRKFEIFTVGIGRGINKQFLSTLSSDPVFNHVFILRKYSDLQSIMETVKDTETRPRRINPRKCGYIRDPSHHLKKWPWLAAIYVGLPDNSNNTRLSFCGGTLICSQWVVTAASCFFSIFETNTTEKIAQKAVQEVFVVMGERNLIHEDKNQLNFYAREVFTHPEFNPLQDLQNNIALIKLNEPAPMGRFRPACLPPTGRPVQLRKVLTISVSIAGWGLPPTINNDREINGGNVKTHSSNTSVDLDEENVCEVYSGHAARENIFCAGLGGGTCIGDLGSPIVAVDPQTSLHHVLGVLSRKSNCLESINQYSDLSNAFSWIDEVTRQCQESHLT